MPVFSDMLEHKRRKEAYLLASALAGLLLVALGAIALLFIFHTEVGLKYTRETAIYLLAMFALGAAWWFIARALRRDQGIDLALAYKEIPPE